MISTVLTVFFICFSVFIVLTVMKDRNLLLVYWNWLEGLIVRNPPVIRDRELQKKYFPQIEELENNYPVIKAELLEVLKHKDAIPKFHEIDSNQDRISKGGTAWRTFFFKGFDIWSENNCKRCPKTTALLKTMPQVKVAMFSILDGKKHIPAHYGPWKGVFRCHLGLIIPKDAPCYINVDKDQYSWKEGEAILFDDTFRHEIYNPSDNIRVVLFLDILRTDVPWLLRKRSEWLINVISKSSFIQNAARKAELPVDLKPTDASPRAAGPGTQTVSP